MKKSKAARACDISREVKEKVWIRDRGKCVVCGNDYNADPNAHFIPRSKLGLGIEQNIVTLCNNFTEKKCHFRFDNGTREEREEIRNKIRDYLMKKYPDWNEEDLYYRKGM